MYVFNFFRESNIKHKPKDLLNHLKMFIAFDMHTRTKSPNRC